MPTCYQLIGVPGSGKSTWTKNQDWVESCKIVSTDKWVDYFAAETGLTYNEVFDEIMPLAVRMMTAEVGHYQDRKLDIVWDQTNTSVASRRKKFSMLPDYKHIAVVFATPPAEELARRLANRPGKIIPNSVMESMIKGFEMPTLDEGFVEIWNAVN